MTKRVHRRRGAFHSTRILVLLALSISNLSAVEDCKSALASLSPVAQMPTEQEALQTIRSKRGFQVVWFTPRGLSLSKQLGVPRPTLKDGHIPVFEYGPSNEEAINYFFDFVAALQKRPDSLKVFAKFVRSPEALKEKLIPATEPTEKEDSFDKDVEHADVQTPAFKDEETFLPEGEESLGDFVTRMISKMDSRAESYQEAEKTFLDTRSSNQELWMKNAVSFMNIHTSMLHLAEETLEKLPADSREHLDVIGFLSRTGIYDPTHLNGFMYFEPAPNSKISDAFKSAHAVWKKAMEKVNSYVGS